MFKISQQTEGKHQYLVIQNKEKQTTATICLTWGGSLQQLAWEENLVINNLEKKAQELVFINSSCGAILFPFVNRIDRGKYTYLDTTYQLPCNEQKHNNALHGLVYNQTFEVVSQEGDEDMAHIVLQYQHGSSEGFPFPFVIELHYEITAISCSLKVFVTNTGMSSFPFSIGWHPYFWSEALEESCILLPTKQKAIVNERMIPTNMEDYELDTPCWLDEGTDFDTAFEQSSSITEFHTPQYSITLESKTPQEKYYTQLYTPAHRHSLAIEPMTAIADCFNNDIGKQELLPQKLYSIHWEINYWSGEEV